MHASLRVESISKLPDPLKTVAISAANGSLDDLAKLHDLIPDSPEAQLRFLIPAFYANLATHDIPDLRRQLDTNFSVVLNRTSMAILALKGVSELQDHLVSRACDEVWSSAWAWIQFLEECEKHRPGETGASRSELDMLYLTTISSLGHNADSLSMIKTTPRVRVFLAKGWVAAVDHLRTSDVLFRDLCHFLFKDVNAKDPRHFQELIEGSGGTVNALALLIVKHVRCAVPDPNHALDPHDGFALLTICSLLEAIGLFHGPLHDALVQNELVKCFTTALCSLCGPPMIMTEQLIPLCLGVLIAHITENPGFPWVKEAVDAGLLRATVLCASRRMPIISVPLQCLFRDILPESLVYHSVLSSLRPALDDARVLGETPEFRSSLFVRQWDAFVALATERLAVMERYDRSEIGVLRACDNLECDAIHKDDALLRCSACRGSFYCSKHCQLSDWANGHRKLCRDPANRLHEDCPQLTFRDRDFMRALLHHDYEAARADILVQQISYMRLNPGAYSYVKFDYSKGRAVIEVGPVMDETAGYGARIAKGGGRLELHVLVAGEGSRTRGHAIPMRVSDMRVVERLSEIAAGGDPVSPTSLQDLGVLNLDVTRTH